MIYLYMYLSYMYLENTFAWLRDINTIKQTNYGLLRLANRLGPGTASLIAAIKEYTGNVISAAFILLLLLLSAETYLLFRCKPWHNNLFHNTISIMYTYFHLCTLTYHNKWFLRIVSCSVQITLTICHTKINTRPCLTCWPLTHLIRRPSTC